MSDEAEWRESLRKEYERANSWKALYTATVTERDELREALEYARDLMFEYGFSSNDLRPICAALEAKP